MRKPKYLIVGDDRVSNPSVGPHLRTALATTATDKNKKVKDMLRSRSVVEVKVFIIGDEWEVYP